MGLSDDSNPRGDSVTMPDAARELFLAPASSTGEMASARNNAGSAPCLPISEIARIVDRVVASWHSPLSLAEQRGSHRLRYERPAVLTPLDERTGEPVSVHKIVSGRDISPTGFSFTHLDPLACRRAIVTFAFESLPPSAVVLRLSWCRFTQAGVYQSGGKFLNPILPPFVEDLNVEELPYA